jgi:hypothetical protein
MEPIAEMIRRSDNHNQALNSSDALAMPPPQSVSLYGMMQLLEAPGVPKWVRPVLQLAQDRRHDLPAMTLEFWKVKLLGIPEELVVEALLLYAKPFFPSIQDVLEIIERKRQSAAALKQEAYWADYDRNRRDIEKFMKAHGGLTPQQQWCAEHPEELARLNALTPVRGFERRAVDKVVAAGVSTR